MSSLYVWLKFLHVLATFGFVFGHGASAAMSLRLKQEKDLTRIQAMLDLSVQLVNIFIFSLLILLVDGIVLGFMGRWWSSGWIWLALALLIGLSVWMGMISGKIFRPLRKACGLPYMDGNKEMPAIDPAPEEEREKLIALINPAQMAWVGYGGFAIIVWLMIFKPF